MFVPVSGSKEHNLWQVKRVKAGKGQSRLTADKTIAILNFTPTPASTAAHNVSRREQ